MEKRSIFTDKFVSNLKPAAKEYWKREGQGFCLRVYPSGEKAWYYIFTFEGRKRFMRLGSYPEVTLATARKAFEAARVKAKNDIDPLHEKTQAKLEKQSTPTVADLVSEYLERHAKKFKRSWQADERLLSREIVPVWGTRRAADITKRDITLLLESILDRGAPAMSNQVLKIARKMFNFAVERDILQHTPFTAVKALAPNTRRERALTEGEIKTFWENLDNCLMSNDVMRALKLILVTAQRPGEVAGLHVREIEGPWWTIPAERTKTGKAHRVFLTAMALELIGDTTEQRYAFPSPRDREKPIEAHALGVALRRNLQWPVTDREGKPLFDSNGKPATENRLGVSKFTPHDLRRSAATGMAGMGFMDEIIDAVLSHVKQGIIRTYNRHSYDREKQQALEAWELKLKSILTGRVAKVISIGTRNQP